jgi:hypothetical protein
VSPILESIGSVKGFGWGATLALPTSFQSIATISGNGSSGVLNFTNIPQTYTHLQIRGFARNSAGANLDNLYVNFNEVYATNSYTTHWIYGYGGATAGQGVSPWTLSLGGFLTAGSGESNYTGGAMVLDILDYTDNTNKNATFKSLCSFNANNTSYSGVSFASGQFLNTAAITNIRFACSNSFPTTTQFALYGIKGE